MPTKPKPRRRGRPRKDPAGVTTPKTVWLTPAQLATAERIGDGKNRIRCENSIDSQIIRCDNTGVVMNDTQTWETTMNATTWTLFLAAYNHRPAITSTPALVRIESELIRIASAGEDNFSQHAADRAAELFRLRERAVRGREHYTANEMAEVGL